MTAQNDQLARMMDMSGEQEGGKAPKYNVPIIKFNGNTGEFAKISYEDGMKSEEAITGEIKIVILKNRKRLEAQEAGLSSVEFNSVKQIVTLFAKVDDKYSKEAIDTVTNLRENYPVLKTQEVLYVLFNGEICKLIVKGGSSTSFYTFKDTLKEEGNHSFAVTTKIGKAKAKSKMGKTYFYMTFESLPLEVSLDEVESKMTEVSEAVAKIDEYNSGKAMSSTSSDEIGTRKTIEKEVKDTEPTIQLDDEIDADDIEI